ncbi:MAG: hypothetical protein GX367_07000 [Bacteroidales bacterium]|nr:hypothetical protein [Bacteroidales bacterium]
MKKRRKSTWLILVLFVYVTSMMIYLIPKNQEISDIEKYITIGVSYVILFLLWWVLRRKENLKRQREEDIEQSKINNKRD